MGRLVWTIISAVVAIGGAFALYFTFLKRSNETKFTGFWGWMYDFLTFKKMLIEHILRIAYLICAIFITLGSFALIGENVLYFFAALIGGNIVLRISYEAMMIFLLICRNTTEINSKMNK